MKKALKFEHILKIVSSFYVIGTSLYDIGDDVLELKKEHGLLLIGLFTLSKVVIELIQKSKELRDDINTI